MHAFTEEFEIQIQNPPHPFKINSFLNCFCFKALVSFELLENIFKSENELCSTVSLPELERN